jgi:hypothetical protein
VTIARFCTAVRGSIATVTDDIEERHNIMMKMRLPARLRPPAGRRLLCLCAVAAGLGCGGADAVDVTPPPKRTATLTVPDTIRASLFANIDVQYQASDANGQALTGTPTLGGFGSLVDAGPTSKPVASRVGVMTGDVLFDGMVAHTTLVVGPPDTLEAFPDTVGLLVAGAPRQLHVRGHWAGCVTGTPCVEACFGTTTCGGYGDATRDVTSWSSSDPRVATVDSLGMLTAVGAGHATVTATIGSQVQARVAVFTYKYSSPLDFAEMAVGDAVACGRTSDERVLCTTTTFSNDGGPYGSYVYAWDSNHPNGFGTTAPTDRCLDVSLGHPLGYYERVPTTYASVRCTRVPMAVDGDHQFTSLAVSDGFGACAVDVSGATWCWGEQPVRQDEVPTLTAISPTTGKNSFCGLTATGAAICFAPESSVSTVPGGHTFASLSSGNGRCGIDASGVAWCWADSTITSETMPVQVQSPAALTSVAIADNMACGLDVNGHVFCWGFNGVAPTPNPTDKTFVAIAEAFTTACGLSAAGTITCWDNKHNDAPLDAPVGSDWVRLFSGAGYYLCATSRTGRTTCWPGLDLSEERDIPIGG